MAGTAGGEKTTEGWSRWLRPRAWPPPRLTPRGKAAISTVRELLRDFREDPPPGLESCDWLVVASDSLAEELKTGVLEGSLHVAGTEEWDSVSKELPPTSELAILRIDLAPSDWPDMLPDGAPESCDLERLGELHAFLTELRLGTARVVSLHAWRTGGEEPTLVPEVSGPVLLEPNQD